VINPGGGPRILWLLRHAKAAEAAPDGTDHARPLTARGRRDAAALGARLAARTLPDLPAPDAVLCSTAARTTETAAGVVGELGIAVDRRRSLYYADLDGVLDEIRTVDDGVRSLMVVGHNPATHLLALDLLDGEDPDRQRLHRFPTCALAVFRLEAARWSDVAAGEASLAEFLTPPY
jgi:phosphohistidine phosphatase